MQNLIDPTIEYAELTEHARVSVLDAAIRRLTPKPSEATLESFFGPDVGTEEVYGAINELTRRAVTFSCYGTLAYFRKGFGAKAANRRWYECHIVAARNYQKVFELSKRIPDAVNEGKLYMYIFMSAAEFHNAMQHSCAKSLVREARPLLESLGAKRESPMEEMAYLLHRALLLFLEGDFAHLGQSVDVLRGQLSRAVSSNQELSRADLLDLSCIDEIAECLSRFAAFVVSGEVEEAERSLRSVESAWDLAGRSGRTDLRYVVDKLRLSLQTLKELSIWNVPAFFSPRPGPSGQTVLRQYIDSKAHSGVYFLFPSQYEALLGGILDVSARRVLISTPTGAGKTVLAELLELSERLAQARTGDVSFYMVPTRALASEKFADFKSGMERIRPELRICQIAGEGLVNTRQAIEKSDIVILTPEKFDMVLRNDVYGKEPSILIVDEFHNIRTGHRGTRIQFDLIRFQERYPKAKVVLISAIVSNFDDIRQWFKADKYFRTTWRPTFARVGIFDAKEKEGRIAFNDGVSVDTGITRQVVRTNAYRMQAAKLAVKLSEDGPCLIFSSSRSGVAGYAKYVSEESEASPLKIDPVSNSVLESKLRRLVGEKDEMCRYFRQGIGLHRGDLPHIIRRIVEEGVRKGAIAVLVSTTTLAEGINLPLKTVIIPHTKVADEDMSMSLFFNLFGRTGRPAMEAEGQVILIARNDCPSPALRRFESARPKDIERIVTPLREIVSLRGRISDSKDFEERARLSNRVELHEAVLDTVSLALIVEGVTDRLSDDGSLLGKVSISGDGVAGLGEGASEIGLILGECRTRLLGYGVVVEKNSILRATDFGRVVYETGFSPGSCALLLRRIPSLCSKLAWLGTSKSNILSQHSAITEILSLMEIPVETNAYFLGEGLPDDYGDVMSDWMNGKPLSDISHEHFGESYSRALISVEGLLAGYSAWFLYCLWKLVSYHLHHQRGVPYLDALEGLPRYAYYGTKDGVALEIMEADLSRELFRDDVLSFIRSTSRPELSKILTNPELLLEEDSIRRLGSLGLRTDESEFASVLHTVLIAAFKS